MRGNSLIDQPERSEMINDNVYFNNNRSLIVSNQ